MIKSFNKNIITEIHKEPEFFETNYYDLNSFLHGGIKLGSKVFLSGMENKLEHLLRNPRSNYSLYFSNDFSNTNSFQCAIVSKKYRIINIRNFFWNKTLFQCGDDEGILLFNFPLTFYRNLPKFDLYLKASSDVLKISIPDDSPNEYRSGFVKL